MRLVSNQYLLTPVPPIDQDASRNCLLQYTAGLRGSDEHQRELGLYCDLFEFEVTFGSSAPSHSQVHDDSKPKDNSAVSTSVDFLKSEERWYSIGKEYWEGVAPDVEGMLGGYGKISETVFCQFKARLSFIQKDTTDSFQFLRPFMGSKIPRSGIALGILFPYCFGLMLDVGAGIGRLTKYLLSRVCDHVDMLEQNSKFLTESKTYLKGAHARPLCPLISDIPEVGDRFCSSLQDFEFTKKYDLIWIQWSVPLAFLASEKWFIIQGRYLLA